MKRFYILLLSLLMAVPSVVSAQSFETGSMYVILSTYGRVRVGAPDVNTRQIDRLSFLFAKTRTEVFDYQEDAENEVPAATVSPATWGDFEASVGINHTYSNRPPVVSATVNAYGWTGGAYTIVKFKVKNNGTDTYNGIVGFEVIPQNEGVYGNETVKYDAVNKVLISYRNSSYVGMKFLSHDMTSVKIFEWYDSFHNDTLFYDYMTTGTFSDSLVAGGDGSVAVVGTPASSFAPGDTVSGYIAIAYGSSQAAMQQNMNEAMEVYSTFVGVKEEMTVADKFALAQNFPNPFNPSTKISFYLDKTGETSLRVYDVLGNEVKTLVSSEMEKGYHEVEFDASSLSSGMYIYRLVSGSNVSVKKMTVLK